MTMLGLTCEFFVTVSFDFGERTPRAGWIWTETWFRFLSVYNLVSTKYFIGFSQSQNMSTKRLMDKPFSLLQMIKWSIPQKAQIEAFVYILVLHKIKIGSIFFSNFLSCYLEQKQFKTDHSNILQGIGGTYEANPYIFFHCPFVLRKRSAQNPRTFNYYNSLF